MEIVIHPGAVAVVPVTEQGEVILLKQYRKPIEVLLLEVPVGKLEPGEDSFSCAVRELKEETGNSAGKMEHLFDFYTSPGFCDEIMHLFLATELTQGESKPDADELLECVRLPLAEAARRVMAGEILDGKTIVGLLAAEKTLRDREYSL